MSVSKVTKLHKFLALFSSWEEGLCPEAVVLYLHENVFFELDTLVMLLCFLATRAVQLSLQLLSEH